MQTEPVKARNKKLNLEEVMSLIIEKDKGRREELLSLASSLSSGNSNGIL